MLVNPEAWTPSRSPGHPITMPTPEDKDLKRLTVYLPAQLVKRLKLLAVEEDRTLSDIVTELVQQWADAQGK